MSAPSSDFESRKIYVSLLAEVEKLQEAAIREAVNQCFLWCLILNSGALTGLIGLAGAKATAPQWAGAVLDPSVLLSFTVGAGSALAGRLLNWFFHYTVLLATPSPGQALGILKTENVTDHPVRGTIERENGSGRATGKRLSKRITFFRYGSLFSFVLSLGLFLFGAWIAASNVKAAADAANRDQAGSSGQLEPR